MSDIKRQAELFYDACESGQGWEVCQAYCHPNATFSCQAGALAEVTTIEGYTEWTKGILTPIPDGHPHVKTFSVDHDRSSVVVSAVFHGTQTGAGGPVPPTGNTVSTDYVYVLAFEGDRIRHMTKIWNDVVALQQLGWA